MSVIEKVHWIVEADFITNLARDSFWKESKVEFAKNLLKSCMVSDQITDKEREEQITEILIGTKQLVGNSKDGIYLEDDNFEPAKHYSRYSRIKTLSYLRTLANYKLYVKVGDELSSYDPDDYETDEYPYGWLDRKGEFHRCKWASHTAWANEYIMHDEALMNEFIKWYQENRANDNITCFDDDFLIFKGWVKLHNAQQGIPYAVCNEHMLNKSQCEFLFDYFNKLKQYKDANYYLNAKEA